MAIYGTIIRKNKQTLYVESIVEVSYNKYTNLSNCRSKGDRLMFILNDYGEISANIEINVDVLGEVRSIMTDYGERAVVEYKPSAIPAFLEETADDIIDINDCPGGVEKNYYFAINLQKWSKAILVYVIVNGVLWRYVTRRTKEESDLIIEYILNHQDTLPAELYRKQKERYVYLS